MGSQNRVQYTVDAILGTLVLPRIPSCTSPILTPYTVYRTLVLVPESFTVLVQEAPKQAHWAQFESKADAGVIRGGGAVKRVATLTAIDLYILADLLERFLVGRKPALQVADAEFAFCILFITSTLTGLLFFDGYRRQFFTSLPHN